VAEDRPVTGHLVTLMLEKMGHSVILATTGLELLACWEQGAFDLVLADINMPGIDGIEATRVIREREKTKGHRVPIVAMTANVMKEDQERFQNAGMDGYLPKPVSMVQLRELIESFLCRTLTDGDARPPQDTRET